MTTIPLWWYGGDADNIDFLDHSNRKCRNLRDLYFQDDLEALAQCRSICITCPVRRQCARWSIRHYDEVPYGIFAGYSAAERRKIYTGRKPFYDWARGWSRRVQTKMLVQAATNRNRKTGIKKNLLNTRSLPACPEGHTKVRRTGRDKEIGRQLYRCLECGNGFTGEEL